VNVEQAMAVAEARWSDVNIEDFDRFTHQEILERALQVLAGRIRLYEATDECSPTGIERPSVQEVAEELFGGGDNGGGGGPYTHQLKMSLDGPWMTMIDVGDDEEHDDNVIPFRKPGQRGPGWR